MKSLIRHLPDQIYPNSIFQSFDITAITRLNHDPNPNLNETDARKSEG